MQRARVQQHGQVRVDGDAAEPRHIRRRRRVEARAVDPLRDEDVPPQELLDHARRDDGTKAARLHGRRELVGVARLGKVVDFVDEASAPFVDQRQRHVNVRLLRRHAVDPVRDSSLDRRQEAKEVQVQRDLGEDVRPLHLERHARDGPEAAVHVWRHPVVLDDAVGPRLERRAVDLADAGRGDRALRDAFENLVQRLHPKRRPQDRLGHCVGEGRHGVLQLPEFQSVRLWDEVRPDGQGLAQLDKRRPELVDEGEGLARAHRLVLLQVAEAPVH
mmetsp:Transcript_10777/g.35880  ORF Transcript_10777/g.35880 Transcript_10777/m.35880 type:complete len:274 (+) Transcript_10777:1057-1878(+)